MRLRFGFLLGFGSGYYLGAKAGRARYEQLNDMLARVRGSETYEATAEKARGLVEERVEVAKEVVEEKVGRAREVFEKQVGQAKEVVEEQLEEVKEVVEEQSPNGRQADSSGVASTLPPGPPPAGSLSDDRPLGGPPA